MSRSFFLRFWLPPVVVAGLIFFLSATPGEEIPSVFVSFDKLLHFLEYLPFGVLLARAFFASGRSRRYNYLLDSFLTAVIYSFSDEIHQIFVEARVFSLVDMFFDAAGATAGIFIYKWLK